MQNNEWGVMPGTQDNIMPENAPMLSELECSLVNMFSALPLESQKAVLGAISEFAYQVHDK